MESKKIGRKKSGGLLKYLIFLGLVTWGALFGYQQFTKSERENKTLKEIIARLTAETRIAEAMVTDVTYDPLLAKNKTTIKFLEYDSQGKPMPPKYFAFFGNIIQFQALVVRFDDIYVEHSDALRGKSVFLFLKAFFLDGANTQQYEITKINEIPNGYLVEGSANEFELNFWKKFWKIVLNSKFAKSEGIKNAQIEAPGTKFVPGMIYTLKIEHDGGIRIDIAPIPEILRGEKITEQTSDGLSSKAQVPSLQ